MVTPANTFSASMKSIPCLRRFDSRLASSHSNLIVVTMCRDVKRRRLACPALNRSRFGQCWLADGQVIERQLLGAGKGRFGLTVDEGAVPQFQHQQAPQVTRVVAPPAQVLLQDRADDVLV